MSFIKHHHFTFLLKGLCLSRAIYSGNRNENGNVLSKAIQIITLHETNVLIVMMMMVMSSVCIAHTKHHDSMIRKGMIINRKVATLNNAPIQNNRNFYPGVMNKSVYIADRPTTPAKKFPFMRCVSVVHFVITICFVIGNIFDRIFIQTKHMVDR